MSNKRRLLPIQPNVDSIERKKNEIITAVTENWWFCKECQYKIITTMKTREKVKVEKNEQLDDRLTWIEAWPREKVWSSSPNSPINCIASFS